MTVLTRSAVAQKLQDNSVGSAGGKGLEPQEFCELWIPKIYGVYPGEELYVKACIKEFITLIRPIGFTERLIRANWVWMGERKHKYPEYLGVILGLAHKQYSALECLGSLPRRTIERGENLDIIGR